MSEKELICEFMYNGCDITAYHGKVEVVSTDESKLIDGRKTAIATTRTFSCTNFLVFCKDFAYLAHMLPSETVGMNNNFESRLDELKRIITHFNPDAINVLISLGISTPHPNKKDFHNLEYLFQKLNVLKNLCESLNVELNLLPIMKSKYFLFDLEKYLLYVENPSKKVIDVNKIENIEKLTKNTSIKSF